MVKASLGMNPHESLWRCRGKAKNKVKKFEEEGDFSHSDNSHLCPECRCHHTAGRGTDHFGLGKCFHHENCVGASRRNNTLVVESQKEAVKQGYPDHVYKYESDNIYLERVREAAEKSGGMSDLREELHVLRGHMQDLMKVFESDKTKLTEGYDKEGCVRMMTDKTYVQLVVQLSTAVAKLSSTNLSITEADYVHVDQVNIWFAAVIRLLQRSLEAEHKLKYDEIIAEIKEIPQMTMGRIK